MPSGGSKPGERRGGRQAGTPNKRTAAREQAMVEAAQRAAAEIGDGAFAGDAHALLVTIYKDPTQPWELRADAAKAAIRYEKPALAATTLEVRDPLSSMTAEHLEALYRIAVAAAAEQGG